MNFTEDAETDLDLDDLDLAWSKSENESFLSFLNASVFNNSAHEENEDPIAALRMAFGLRVMWDFLFGIAMGISILGNTVIIWIILSKFCTIFMTNY